MHITGTQLNYFFVCKRKLWLFANHIQCEQESDLVLQGKIMHENSYSYEKKEYEFEGIKVDWLDLNNKVIHEVKKSDKVEEAHLWQLKYYLYYFRKNNIGEFTGEINYPKLRKKEQVMLTDDDVVYIEKIIDEIEVVKNLPFAPKVEKPMKICKKCSYNDLCWV
ncbi:MAG: CRISPR-associated protein Cas4 [Candidatus Kapabacteria bacterium]|nr:CRISPR-associated protein Cas4 [Ignavibacteriota bacterium]MCW5883400.1 CRISPR-associated protein Cas4 [Candidatus Kapabacteria bacterium]